MDNYWQMTLTGKFDYDWSFLSIPLDEFIEALNSSEDNKKKEVKKKTYTYDIYTTIIQTVTNIYSNNKDHMRLYIRGQLDADEYVEKVHQELIQLYTCYKNTPDEIKLKRGFYLKRVDRSYRDDIYTTYVDNLDRVFYEVYTNYIDIVLKKITERILLNGIENM